MFHEPNHLLELNNVKPETFRFHMVCASMKIEDPIKRGIDRVNVSR